MIRRARLVAVVSTLAVGAAGVISSTQTWLTVVLADGAQQTLTVSGASAVPVLAPLSLAVLALGAALSIVGLALRIAFGVLTVGIALTLALPSAVVALALPVSAVAAAVTASTGIAGEDAVAALVASITATAWPTITLACSAILFVAGGLILVTARTWTRGGRRFESEPGPPADATPPASRPLDAIDSWDDLSRGEDPTAEPDSGPR